MPPRSSYRIIDVDIHHQYPSPTALTPYLEDPGVIKYYGGGGLGTPNLRGAFRQDSYPPTGGQPGSDPHFLVENHFERYAIEYGVLNHFVPGGTYSSDVAADIARACNDWTIEEWFPVDDRFLGSITVSGADPDRAADEIRRLGSHPRMVQVTTVSVPCLLGNRFLHPIYEACSEFGLPFNFHVGGADAGATNPSYSVGRPTTFVEHHTGFTIPAQHHTISLVCEGVFVKYPNLRVVFNEFGVAWLPFVMWRLDMEYRAGREEVPWLSRLPSEYIRDHVRFSTQPLEVPADPKDLVTLLSLVDGDRMLMFASDYPHWDFDSPDHALRGFPEEWKQKLFWDNAWEFYALEQRLAEPAGVGAA
jgi:uncharacterized protein